VALPGARLEAHPDFVTVESGTAHPVQAGVVIPDHGNAPKWCSAARRLEDRPRKRSFDRRPSRRDETTGRYGNVITSADGCICLVVTDGPIDPTVWGKILKALTGL
jgi:hypothetical protein